MDVNIRMYACACHVSMCLGRCGCLRCIWKRTHQHHGVRSLGITVPYELAFKGGDMWIFGPLNIALECVFFLEAGVKMCTVVELENGAVCDLPFLLFLT